MAQMDIAKAENIVNEALRALDKARGELTGIKDIPQSAQCAKMVDSIDIIYEYGLRIWCDLWLAKKSEEEA